MSTPDPETALHSPAQPRAAELESGPFAQIKVEYVLGAENPFTFIVETASRVTVETDGAIRIAWQPDDPPAQLEFALTTDPGSSWLDGFQMGWREPDVPKDNPPSLSYSLVALPSAGLGVPPRTLIVHLDRDVGAIYSYSLHVAYATGGQSDRIDPKIYNEGNGGPPPGRR